MNSCTTNAEFFCPVHEQHCAPVVCEDSRVSSIAPLLLHCGPAAVARFVVAIVVLSFNCHTGWLDAHVGSKVFELVPAIAHNNPPASVMLERAVIRVSAPLNHPSPRGVRVGVGQAVLPSLASTTLDFPEVPLVHRVQIAAIANELAEPSVKFSHASQPPRFLAKDGFVARFTNLSSPFTFHTPTALRASIFFEDVGSFQGDVVAAVACANPQVPVLAFASVFGDFEATSTNAATVDETRVFWHGGHA